ncbi:tyrosine recombinase XerC [Spirochaetia bacterium]|nr:tyrosine recombinase XerC [Spirochaetia bacterium]
MTKGTSYQCVPTFAEYAVDFWDWEKSAYLKDRRKRYNLARSYADKNAKLVGHTFVPYFGKMRLDKITPEEVEMWVDYMLDEEYKHTTINGYYGTLLTMITYAAKKKVIPFNPLTGFERLVSDRKKLEIITPEEFKKLFVNDWKNVWNDDLIVYMANKMAALTGMRCSEVLGLTGEYVFDNNIFLNAQYDEYGYRETKTKVKHHIPLTQGVIDELRRLMDVNGKGYLFSLDGGVTPINRKTMYNGFIKALKNIGFKVDQIRDRGLNLHAWRHFCVTELQKAGLTIQQVMAVTGHKSERMTEIYTHFDPAQFGKVPQVQESLLRPDVEKKPDRSDSHVSGRHGLTLVKMPEKPENQEQMRA